MTIIKFLARPNKVKLNQIMLLISNFIGDDDDKVVYQISDTSLITFTGGVRKIESDIVGMEDFTTTTLEGPNGGVLISAYPKKNPNNKITKLVRII